MAEKRNQGESVTQPVNVHWWELLCVSDVSDESEGENYYG